MKKTIAVLGIFVLLGILTFAGISNKHSFSPVSTNAQQSQDDVFNNINQLAVQNNQFVSYSNSADIARMLSENLLVFEIPATSIYSISDYIANAHLNGASDLDENNIVAAINELAGKASAPSYTYTNFEQVRVVRSILNRAMPDLVSPSGTMTDLEAFAVFEATLSQKISNDAFMVSAAEFSASMSGAGNNPVPGSPAATTGNVSFTPESAKSIETGSAINAYVNSGNMSSAEDIISMIGIK